MRTDRDEPQSAPFDVGVVGGGPAGAVVAQMLATAGVRVVVLEAAPGPWAKTGECLPASVRPLLDRLGLREIVADPAHLESQGRRSVWGSDTPLERHALSEPRGPSWHLDRGRFEEALALWAQSHGVSWRWGWRLRHAAQRDAAPRDGGWRLTCTTPEGEEELGVGWVVDASGRTACFARRQSEIRRLRYDRLVGVAVVLSGSDFETDAFLGDAFLEVEAVADGWWYSARLAEDRLVVVRFGDGDLLDSDLLQGSLEAWDRALTNTETTRRRIESAGFQGPRRLEILPADTSRLEQITGAGWLAVGDAAAAYDPLSSHGMASAMGSGYYAARALLDLRAGRPEALDGYRLVMQQAYGTYLDLLRSEYAREPRFADQPFWRRRHRDDFGILPLPSTRQGERAKGFRAGMVV